MKTLLLILSFSILIPVSQNLYAQQNEPDAVKAVINHLFDGMRESDSSKVAAAFTGDAVMQTIGQNQEGEAIINTGNLDGFLHAVGSPKEELWDEKISSYNVNIDGNLASVWTPYQFYRSGEFSHCGVNSFQLIKKEEGWKIFHIVDTRRQDDCVE